MLKNQFKYSNFLLYASGLTKEKYFLNSEIDFEKKISQVNVDYYPRFKEYFNQISQFELQKNYRINKWANQNQANLLEPLSYLTKKKEILKSQFKIINECEIYKINYALDRLMYFEFSKGFDLDDYLEKVIKVDSTYIFKLDMLSRQDIELRLNKVQRLFLGLIRENVIPLGDIITYVVSGDLIPEIKWNPYHKNLVLKELIPLIYWGFIIPINRIE
jgi:hypothetical protein